MAKLPTIQQEAQNVAEQGGYYISPYQLAEMSKTASKIIDMLSKSGFQPSYAECKIVLDIVQKTLRTGENLTI